MHLLSSSLLALSISTISKADVSLTVDLEYSTYQGQALSSGLSQWFGIRYAAPPVGDLRFRAPQDPPNNSTLQIADTHGRVCYSSPSTTTSSTNSEDCLFLDVYAPTKNSKSHPVMIWFQGGGLNSDANPNLNATSLIIAADRDLVVVVFNYRVGPYGFLASKEVVANGDTNAGLKDQRKVLEWIQKNIAKFGGDPNHVTIAGDSAGGGSVVLHLTAYGGRDDGLFHAGAAESQSFGAQLTVEESQYQYDALVERTGCKGSSDTLACLRNVDIHVIADNNPNVPTPGGAGGDPVFMWSNVVDGDFTPDYAYNLLAQGKFVKVPVIFGDDTNEGTVFTPTSLDNQTSMNNFLKDNFVRLTSDQLAEIDVLYPKAEQFPNSGSYWRAASNAYGEMRYICPGIYVSSAFPKYGMTSSWNYHWDYLTAADAASGYGVMHTAEFSSIWGMSGNPLTDTIQGYWTSFFRTKDPNTYRLSGSPEWTTFSADAMQRIHFPNTVADVAMETVLDDQKTRCAYVSSIAPSISQ